MNTDKEFFLNLLDQLENVCNNMHSITYHWRLDELLRARDEMIKECLMTLGLIETQKDKGNK